MTVTTGSNNNNNGGITFFGLLAIAFIVMRICGVIHWNWVWVLAPLWMPACVIVFVAVLIILIGNWKLHTRGRGGGGFTFVRRSVPGTGAGSFVQSRKIAGVGV